MSDGYPTSKDLRRIRDWPAEDLAEALDFVAGCWSDYGTVWCGPLVRGDEASVVGADVTENYLRVVTGGWSGNEELIGAMMENDMLWMMCWRMSARGGLFIFQYPEET